MTTTTTKLAGDIEVGDYVIASDGRALRVESIERAGVAVRLSFGMHRAATKGVEVPVEVLELDVETVELAAEACSCDEEDPRAIQGGHRCGSCWARDEVENAKARVELERRGIPPVVGGSPELDEFDVRTAEDLERATRALEAVAERTRVGQRLEADDGDEAILRRVVRQAEDKRDRELAAPAAPIILVTTGHPTLHQHPGAGGEDVHPRLGRLIQPRHTSSIELTAAAGIPWAADNDCFQGLDEARFVRMLDRIAGLPGCLFATVPDVVADSSATRTLFDRWAPELERRGIPAGYVLQDGETVERVPWARIAAVFVGGSDDFKLGPDALELAREAKRRGKWVHWGRVNTRRRFDYIVEGGAADSFDGSKWARWRKTYLPAALEWLDAAATARRAALELGLTPAQAVKAVALADLMARRTVVLPDGREFPAVVGGSPELDDLLAEYLVLREYDLVRSSAGHDYGNGRRYLELTRRERELIAAGVELERITADFGDVADVDVAAAFERVARPRIARLERGSYRRQTRIAALRSWASVELAVRGANPRLEAMRAEAARLRAGNGPEGGSIAELERAGILERALRAYRTDAELEAAEALSAAQDYTDGGGPTDEHGRRLGD